MVKIGKVEKALTESIEEQDCLHFSLIDPETRNARKITPLARKLQAAGTAAFLVGGSTGGSLYEIDETISELKKGSTLPIILFPGSSRMISRHADAILFMSLLNSMSTQFLIGEQVSGAPLVRRYGLEAIPTGYLVFGSRESTVSIMGQANPIPLGGTAIGSAYALAAEFLGMRFVYLEGGSGARKPVSPAVIKSVRKTTDLTIMVGGGIRSREAAKEIVNAGAQVVVTGNLIEKEGPGPARSIIDAVRSIK